MKNKVTGVIKYLSLAVLVFIAFALFLTYGLLGYSYYEENTSELNNSAPNVFLAETKLDYPKDAASLLHISERKLGPNFATNIIFSVSDVDAFVEQASKMYTFKELVIDYPRLDGEEMGYRNGMVLIIPFCKDENELKGSDFEGEIDTSLIKEFCGEHKALFVQIDINKQNESGVVMTILPEQKLVWLNSSNLF